MENTEKIFTIKGVLNEAYAIIKQNFWTVVGQFTLIFLGYLILSVGLKNIFILRTIVAILYLFVVTIFSLSYANKGSFHFDDVMHRLTLKKFCYFAGACILYGLVVMVSMLPILIPAALFVPAMVLGPAHFGVFLPVMLVGALVLTIPGIIVGIMFGYYKYEILEKDISPMQALKESRKITKGYRFKILGLMFVSVLLVILGFICVFVGSLFAIPLVIFAETVVYKKLSTRIPSPESKTEPAQAEETVVEEAPKDAVEVEATPV